MRKQESSCRLNPNLKGAQILPYTQEHVCINELEFEASTILVSLTVAQYHCKKFSLLLIEKPLLLKKKIKVQELRRALAQASMP